MHTHTHTCYTDLQEEINGMNRCRLSNLSWDSYIKATNNKYYVPSDTSHLPGVALTCFCSSKVQYSNVISIGTYHRKYTKELTVENV